MKVSVYDNLQVKCEGQKIVFSLLKMQTYFRHGFLHLKTPDTETGPVALGLCSEPCCCWYSSSFGGMYNFMLNDNIC